MTDKILGIGIVGRADTEGILLCKDFSIRCFHHTILPYLPLNTGKKLNSP